MRRLFIVARDRALRRALRDYIAIAGVSTEVEDGPDLFSLHPPSGAAVIAAAPEMSPGSVAYLKRGHDLRVLVLAPIPTDRARLEYETQGAAYIPMTVEHATLIDSLRAILT